MRLALAFLLLPSALSTVPSCAVAGQGYDDPVVTTANGGLGVTDASACQALCAARHLCSVFTYYSADGGCWLQGSGLKPKPMPGAVAGPRSCEEFSEASDKASWAEEAVAAENAAAEASAGTVGSAVVADVSTLAPTVPEALTTPMPSRFIKAGEALYYAEGMHPRRVHLVRFLSCGGCESACDHYIHVNPDYVASLQQDIDFTCDMLVATTTPETSEFQEIDEGYKPGPWWWPLLLCLLMCCCMAGFLMFDEDWKRRAKGFIHGRTARRGRTSEMHPLTGSLAGQDARQGQMSALPQDVLGPGPPVSGITTPQKDHRPRLFSA